MLLVPAPARVVGQDPPHHLGRDPEEVRAVLPVHAALVHEAQEGLVDQVVGLEGLAGPLPAEVPPGQPPQLVVDERRDLVEGRVVTAVPPVEQERDVVRRPFLHSPESMVQSRLTDWEKSASYGLSDRPPLQHDRPVRPTGCPRPATLRHERAVCSDARRPRARANPACYDDLPPSIRFSAAVIMVYSVFRVPSFEYPLRAVHGQVHPFPIGPTSTRADRKIRLVGRPPALRGRL